MNRLRKLVIRIFGRMMHRKATQKVRDAEYGLQIAKSHAQIVDEHIVQPGRSLREENNFANIVRESLRIGHTER